MKLRNYVPLLGFVALLVFQPALATSIPLVATPPTVTIKDPNPLSLITAKQFVELTPQQFAALTGKKMSMLQKLEFRVLQHKVKRLVKKGEVVTMADVQKKYEELNTMNVLGLLLGLVLGPVGVVIALILKETGDVGPDVVRWSLYGLLIWLAILLVVIIL